MVPARANESSPPESTKTIEGKISLECGMEVVRDSALCAKLQSWKDSGQFCDLTMSLGEETVSAHACIVAAALPAVQELLLKTGKGGAKTGSGYSIRLDGLCQYGEVMQGIVDHVYGRLLEVNHENVLYFLEAAFSLRYAPAVEECLSFMVENVTPTNALTWYNAAVTCTADQASRALLQYVEEHIGEIARSESFLQLPRINAEVAVAKGEESCVQQEQLLLKRASTYVEELLSSSNSTLESLCEHTIIIHSDQLLGLSSVQERDDMHFTVFQSPGRPFHLLAKMNGNCSFKRPPARQLILEGHSDEDDPLSSTCTSEDKCSSFVLARLEQRASTIALVSVKGQFASLNLSCQYSDVRGTPSPTTGIIMDSTSSLTFLPSMREGKSGFGCTVSSKGIVVFGGYNRDGCLSSAEIFTDSEGWRPLPSLMGKRGRLAAASVGGALYAIGGSDGMSNLHSSEVYCLDNDAWSKKGMRMIQPRSSFAAVAVSDTVYAIGGSLQSQALQSVECLNVLSGTWSLSKAMSTPRADLVAVEHDGHLYAIGGTNYQYCLASVECFNAVSGNWEPIPAMNTRRRGAAAVSFEGQIYVFGGCDGRGLLRSVEVYSPKSNSWSEAPSMAQPRCGAQAVVYSGSIYIIGGYSTWGFLTTMERYEPTSESWSSYY